MFRGQFCEVRSRQRNQAGIAKGVGTQGQGTANKGVQVRPSIQNQGGVQSRVRLGLRVTFEFLHLFKICFYLLIVHGGGRLW